MGRGLAVEHSRQAPESAGNVLAPFRQGDELAAWIEDADQPFTGERLADLVQDFLLPQAHAGQPSALPGNAAQMAQCGGQRHQGNFLFCN